MPTIRHTEKHFLASDNVRDVVIGMADGLTVPFALAAGLSGAVNSTDVIIVAGLAEIAAGAIAMGLGGYLAARTDREHYDAELSREAYEVDHLPKLERDEIEKIFQEYGLEGAPLKSVVDAVTADKKRWIDFMMRYELGLERPNPRRAFVSAFTIGGSYILGGFVPLASYFFTADPAQALGFSVLLTGLALAFFGAAKARLTGVPVLRGALQTLLVGGLAASAAYAIASVVG